MHLCSGRSFGESSEGSIALAGTSKLFGISSFSKRSGQAVNEGVSTTIDDSETSVGECFENLRNFKCTYVLADPSAESLKRSIACVGTSKVSGVSLFRKRSGQAVN